MLAALDGFKAFKILNIFSGDVSKNCKFKSFDTALLLQQDATLDSVKILGERGSLDSKFCARLEKEFLKMKQFFVALKIILFLPFKQMFAAVNTLDGKPIDFKVGCCYHFRW